ncbi:MAG: MoaD/ThiS family protein [Proteobacteria bacterium]|nr:MoaD/ThiS family protein [Desulfobacterales bacterium]MBL6967860.1 MoaD/ThiS family protein [Desulfobacteraceae bacterium]MBU0734640.1 MoaD/ThiS family protein [Pseudomonadota bacterium]MBL7101716.1 MoaD/ThiS family protein [Desulfobacteraceae bacterium]MBL7172902.1 MoaD/ThiS family protein [Desulfobacteraceae bacterium]
MSIKIHIHKTHRQHTNEFEVVEVEGDTVGKCLDRLIRQFPAMKEVLFDRNGKLLNVIEIYINMKSAFPDELAKPLKDGDEIHLTVMLAGG